MILPLLVSLILSLAQFDKPPPASSVPRPPPCLLPPVDPDTRLILAGFYEGAGVSTVAVAGQDDEATVGDVHIEPGRERLTLVFVNYEPIIYRFSGATGRVARVILLHRDRTGAGATGLPRARVAFGSSESCGLSHSIYEDSDGHQARRAGALFGRAPDAVGGAYELQWAVIGSGRIAPAPIRRNHWRMQGFEAELYRFYPSGVIALRPRDVVASRPPERFQVLPNTAGLVQLLREGALVPATPRDAETWLAAAARSQAYSDRALADLRGHMRQTGLRVVRPILLPARLCGAHSVLLFAPDPSFVHGDPCHSDLFFADGTGRGTITRPDRRP
ncbi:MAG TPA: hypothetical protein VMS43_10915 [Allosphingosinicella sp.]|nr:hypothetical protein [Allosphingosinicella sp.]